MDIYSKIYNDIMSFKMNGVYIVNQEGDYNKQNSFNKRGWKYYINGGKVAINKDNYFCSYYFDIANDKAKYLSFTSFIDNSGLCLLDFIDKVNNCDKTIFTWNDGYKYYDLSKYLYKVNKIEITNSNIDKTLINTISKYFNNLDSIIFNHCKIDENCNFNIINCKLEFNYCIIDSNRVFNDFAGELKLDRSNFNKIANSNINSPFISLNGINNNKLKLLFLMSNFPNLINLQILGPYVRKGDMGNMIFVKTARKNFSEYLSIKEILNPGSMFYQLVLDSALDIDFIISEPAAIKKIELPLPQVKICDVTEEKIKGFRYINAEYRCIVIKGKLCNMSLYTDELLHKVPEEAYDFAIEVMNKMKENVNTLETYNFDIMQLEDNTWDVIEFHTVPALGRYLYNNLHIDLENCNVDLRDECLHTDPSKLPFRVIQDINSNKKKVVEVTEYIDKMRDYSLEDNAYLSPYQSMKKRGLAMAYILLRMADVGIVPGLESSDPQTRMETKENVIGFMKCFGAEKKELEELVNAQEERLQIHPCDEQEIIDKVRLEEIRLKNSYDNTASLNMSDAWYVNEAKKMGLLDEQEDKNGYKKLTLKKELK